MSKHELTASEAAARRQLIHDLKTLFNRVGDPKLTTAERTRALADKDNNDEYFRIRRALHDSMLELDLPEEIRVPSNLESFWNSLNPPGCTLEESRLIADSLFAKLIRTIPVPRPTKSIRRKIKVRGVLRKYREDLVAKGLTDSTLRLISLVVVIFATAGVSYGLYLVVANTTKQKPTISAPKPEVNQDAGANPGWKPLPKSDPNDNTVVKGS